MTKNIIVTGAAKGIGKAIAKKLSAEGYYIVAIDMDRENGKKLEKEQKGKLEFHQLDISSEKDVENFFWNYTQKHNTLYALVNNAGIIRDNLIWNMPSSDFDAVVDVNLKGTWLMCREAARMMKTQNQGRIINITSRAWLGNRGQSNYSASKAGVVGLTRVLALELGKYNVLVNAVAPGLIDTPMTQKLDEAVLKKLIEAQPTRSMGKPEDIANTVTFLASEKTNFITGQTIYVDGGKSIGAGI
jgi:NAD(P)-dependent dehydrogenase (short-subunit alcohol dehydrogenase family)